MNMGVSIGTVQRIEAGDPGVSLGNIAMAFLVLNCLVKLQNVLTPTTDEIGATMDRINLPKRVRSTYRSPKGDASSTNELDVISF